MSEIREAVDRLTAKLKGDPELQDDIHRELTAHLEEAIATRTRPRKKRSAPWATPTVSPQSSSKPT